MNQQFQEITEYIPHRFNMQLIDTLLDVGPGFAQCSVEITPESSFFEAERGVPSRIAIEYMAQTVAAMAGWLAKQEGDPPPTGFLLGTRKFTANVTYFPAGTKLICRCDEVFVDDNGLGSYNCSVQGQGIEASCRLTVYRNAIDEA